MRILQLIPSLIDGGAERFVVDLCNELVLTDEVYLCSFFPINQNEAFFKEELSHEVKIMSLHKKLGFDSSVFMSLRKLINKIDPHIVHTHLNTLNYLLPLTLIPGQRFRVIHTVHNDASKEVNTNAERKIRHWFYRNKKARPVTISKESDNSFKKVYPQVGSTMIYNGTRMPKKSSQFESVESFIKEAKKNSETKVFVHIGRVTPQKNHTMLVAAFQKLLDTDANALLIMIGGERDTPASQTIVQLLKNACNENILWVGGNQPATDYLKLADFFCLSSIYEGMPISLIEAFACQSLPVCTPVGGIPEMIGDLGVLSEDVDTDSYYQSLKKVYELDKTELEKRTQSLLALFNDQYSIKYCAENYRKLYVQKELALP